MTSRVSVPLTLCVLAAAVAGFLLFRQGPSASQPAAPADPTATEVTIEIADFAFAGDLTIASGEQVVVRNADGAPHTVTADSADFTTGTISAGGTGSFVAPTAPGTYAFFCEIHPSMRGSLTVT